MNGVAHSAVVTPMVTPTMTMKRPYVVAPTSTTIKGGNYTFKPPPEPPSSMHGSLMPSNKESSPGPKKMISVLDQDKEAILASIGDIISSNGLPTVGKAYSWLEICEYYVNQITTS